ncbi:MAG TPA: Type 1 glutamine amidotransferase-like domain-containing protein [Anaerolineales bacterium]|nr:Type 1 glutamine amidotransferase-like domain-containing protein [Anaerolineales bacterium]
MGYLLLEGGAEFGGQMREPDLKAIELAGGLDAPVRIIPTAAAPDNNHQRAGNHGIRWFQSLGAKDVISVPLLSRIRAEDQKIAQSLRDAKLIYMLGGFPHYLGQTLKNSLAWQAVLQAYQDGAVIAGSSAGAMVMCESYYDPSAKRVHEGLNLVSNAIVLPHHNTFGAAWAPALMKKRPAVTLIGIDEQTGMLEDGANQWAVHGRGAVTLYAGDKKSVIERGQSFSL